MSSFEVIDPAFGAFVLGNAPLKKLATGFDWVEGPVWFGYAGCLLFSDIPNNRILRWTPETGISTYRAPSNYSNGHTRDLQGRLLSCEHGTRRVTRTEHDGSITVIADAFEGKRLNSPNDIVVKSDGTIWFSDPHYGIMTDYEGFKSTPELPCNVYCVWPETGQIKAMVT
ncbi:MAG: SMP-30/gluconolactonase/LRE family protein, partial [Cypionkella sp.]